MEVMRLILNAGRNNVSDKMGEAKKLNKKSKQGNMTNSNSANGLTLEEAVNADQRSMNSVSNQGLASNSVNGSSLNPQQSEGADAQLLNSIYGVSSNLSSGSDLGSIKKANNKSKQNKAE